MAVPIIHSSGESLSDRVRHVAVNDPVYCMVVYDDDGSRMKTQIKPNISSR